MKYFCLLLCLGLSLRCTAQNSYQHEKEEHIEKPLFPKNALDFLENTLPKKVKEITYYKKQDSLKVNYKAKLIYKGQELSIQFSEKGTLEDVKVTIKQKYIPPRTLEMIKKYLYNEYTSFRIKKIQHQYKNTTNTDPEKVVRDVFSNNKKSSYSYEIIAEVKTKKKRYFIEITFTKNGDFEDLKS